MRTIESPPELRVLLTAGEVGTTHSVLIRQPGAASTSTAVEQLVEALRAFGAGTMDPTSYVLRSERLDILLEDDATLIAQGIDDGDTLVLLPRPQAQAPPSFWDEVDESIEVDDGVDSNEAQSGLGSTSTDTVRPGDTGRRLARRGLAVAIVAGGAIAAFALHDGRSSPASIAPRVPTGRYVQLASFRSHQDAEQFAHQVRAHHLHPRVIASGDVENLYPAWQVVAIGPLSSANAQRAMVRRVRRAGFREALVRSYTAATSTQSAQQLAGEYAGAVTRVDPRNPHHTRRLRVTVVLRADGRGTIRYHDPTCVGTLTAASPDTALFWNERITSGACPHGGHWATKRYEGHLVMVWRASRAVWAFGRLPPKAPS